MVRGVGSKRKNILLLFFIVAAVVFMLSGAMILRSFAATGSNIAVTSLFQTENCEVQTGALNAEEERYGVLLTASEEARVRFEDHSALFGLTVGLPGEQGEAAFDTLSFEFTDADAGVSFTLSLLNNSEKGNVRLTHQGVNLYMTADGISFTGDAVSVMFDGTNMLLSVQTPQGNTNLFDFSSSSDMRRFGAFYTLDRFTEYDVTMRVSSIHEGKTANIYLYELSGEPLTGENLTDAAGAQAYGIPALYNGTAGKRYYVSTSGLSMYDLVDGRSEFAGDVAVYDKNGQTIELDGDLSFVPQKAGNYTAEYRAKDANGKTGEPVSFHFTVTTQESAVQWEMQYPVYEGNIPKGTQVWLPAAAAVSSSASDYSPALETELTVVAPNDTIADTLSANVSNAFTFSETGTYTVKYTAVDYDRTERELAYSVTVVDGDPVERDAMEREMLTGDYLYLPSASQGSGELRAEAVLPDGSRSNFPRQTLDQPGVWTIRYYDGSEKVFEEYVRVHLSAETFWEGKNGVDIAAETHTPDYYDFSATGLGISASLPTGQAFFTNTVNLAGKTKNDKLLEFLVTPAVEEETEINSLELVIRDVHDENNYITITFKRNPWGYRQLINVTLTLSSGQSLTEDVLLETTLYGKFTGGKISTDPYIYDPTITKPVSVYWDAGENAVYLSPARSTLSTVLLADLDSSETFGAGNEWGGFTTGEVEIGFVFRDTNDTAHIIVTEFDGLDLTGGEIIDSVAPSVTVSDAEAVGVVGQNYPLPEAYGVDSIDGTIENVSVTVRYIDGNKKILMPMTGRFSFIPDRVGTYEVVYSITDRAGNTGMRTLTLQVVQSLDPIQLTQDLSEIYSAKMFAGDRLRLTEIEAVGGSGALTCTKYLFGSSMMQELTDNSVLLTKAGSYMLRYTVSDYLGNTVNFDFHFEVEPGEGPVFANTTVPEYLLAGKSYTLPNITATDYSDGIENAAVELYVDGVKKNAGDAIIAEKDFVLKAVASGKSGRSEKEYPISVVSPRADQNFMADFFITQGGITKNVLTNGISFTAAADSEFSFLNLVPTNRFTLNFSAVSGAFTGTFGVKFTDPVNSDVSVLLTFGQTGGKVMYGINGGAMREMNGSVFSMNGFTFGFNGQNLTDVDGNSVAVVAQTLLGDKFEGFTDGKAYVSFAFSDVQGSSAITLRQLCNQVLNNSSTDRIRPMIVFAEELAANAEFGDKVMLPKGIAIDLLDSEVSFSVLISAPDGSTVYEGDPFALESFNADQYGKYYLTYTAEDSAGNSASSYLSVQVLNREVPNIEIQGEIPAELKTGESFVVPKAVTGEGITLKIYIISPNGVRTLVEGGQSFTVERAGIYRLMYYAYNSDYNSQLIVRDIAVS